MELERLFAALVTVIRDTDPKRLHQTHRLRDIQHGYVPYRDVRQELGLECSEDHEVLLLRMCAGEGALFSIPDDEILSAFRREAEGTNPDLSLLQEFGDMEVRLEDAAIEKAMAGPTSAGSAYQPPGEASEDPVTEDTEAENDNPEATVIPLNRGSESQDFELPTPPPIPEPVHLHIDSRDKPVEDTEPVSAPPFDLMPDGPAEVPASQADSPACAYCGGTLPGTREAHFCPHCGQNLHMIRCGQCQAELEYGWRHCIACGHPVPDS